MNIQNRQYAEQNSYLHAYIFITKCTLYVHLDWPYLDYLNISMLFLEMA